MPVKSYSDLIAWQKAMELTVKIYKYTEYFPKSEVYGLQSQLRRSAVSIPSNIAEGQGRRSTKEFLHFLSNAKGSLAEAETQIILAFRLGFFNQEQQKELLKQTDEMSRILSGLRFSLQNKRQSKIQ